MNVKTISPPAHAVLALLLGCFLVMGSAGLVKADNSNSSMLGRPAKGFVDVVKKAMPAVVHIKVEKTAKTGDEAQLPEELFNNPFFEQFFGPYYRQQPREYKQQGQGSGFIISQNGLILTNNHVVAGADDIKVILSDNREFAGKVVGTDPQTDVALIKINDPENLPVLPLGDSSDLEPGEWVIAIGNPFGLSQTVTVGVVSATGRSSIGINDYENFIQTDAAINPGNSGGPLLNTKGEAVGINTALFSKTGGYMGIGFAIPINMAKSIEAQLQQKGKVTRGWLGVVIQDVSKDLAEQFNLKNAKGILVSEVQGNTPASAAGLKQGDIILKLNDAELANVSDLRNKIAMMAPGSTALLDIVRDGRDKKIQVTIGEQPSNFDKQAKTEKPANNDTSLDKYGLAVQELTPELADRFGYQAGSGLIISDVQDDSPAAIAGLKPGYLVEEVNRTKVRTLEDLKRALKQSASGGKLLMRVRSGDFSTYVVLGANK